MARVLITGMSGVGKSTVIGALNEQGYTAVDTDYGPWKTADGLWDLDRVRELPSAHEVIAVSGAVDNQGLLYEMFDHVVLLTAPPTVMIERVMSRDSNPYGSSEKEREEILANKNSVEPLIRATATAVIETTQPLQRTVAEIARLLDTPQVRFT